MLSPIPGIDIDITKHPPERSQLSKFSKSQFGGRIKQILGPFDLGLIYYNGFYSELGFYLDNIELDFSTLTVSGDLYIDFTRAQLFGLEATFIAGPVTLMAEGGFWLSEDMKGEKPDKFNNKWVYLAGVGVLIPGTSVYASFTYNGHYIMDFKEYDPSDPFNFEVDTLQALLSSDGKAYSNTLTAALVVPLAREKILLRLAGTYQIETNGYALLPSLKWNISDDLVFKASGRLFGSIGEGSASIFKAWNDNNSVKLEIGYLF